MLLSAETSFAVLEKPAETRAERYLAMLDQAALSLSNFGLHLALVRYTAADVYGFFSVGVFIPLVGIRRTAGALDAGSIDHPRW